MAMERRTDGSWMRCLPPASGESSVSIWASSIPISRLFSCMRSTSWGSRMRQKYRSAEPKMNAACKPKSGR